MKLWAILLAAAGAAFAQTVEITVLSAGDGARVAGVKVELRQNDRAIRQGVTDGQGACRFDALEEGDYAAAYTKSGYRQVRRTGAGGPAFHVASGGNALRVEARMLRLGQLSGRVLGSGKPVAGADVQLFLAGNFISQDARTNANGEFAFRDVDPGTYVLSARATKASPPAPAEDGRKLGWVRTWYPGEPDSAGASKLLVAEGSDWFGQDILLRSVAVHRVAGRVFSPKGEPIGGATVKAAPPEEFAVADFELATQSKEDGSFEFAELPDGNWRLTAEAKADGLDLYAGRVETVDGRDLDHVELRFIPPFSIKGKLVRTPSGTPAEKKTVGVMLAQKEGGYRLTLGMTREDGTFQIDSVAQGIYRFQPTSPGAPYYLASIESGGRDLTGHWVELTPGMLPVTINYRSDGGSVRGTVEDCGGATVVLAPQDPLLQYFEFVRQAKCGPSGRFEITGLRPGEYYAFAFEKPAGMLEISSVAVKWVNQAVRITVRAGEATDASLKVTQRGDY